MLIVGERVHFSVEGDSLPDSVSFIINECTISNDEYAMSYGIVNDGCVDSLTQTMYHNDGPFSSAAHLSYAAFRFDAGADLSEDQQKTISCTVRFNHIFDRYNLTTNLPWRIRYLESPVNNSYVVQKSKVSLKIVFSLEIATLAHILSSYVIFFLGTYILRY